MDEHWPSVSIVIPARNCSARLQQVLRACREQDYAGPWEVIVVDNGSTDETARVAESAAGTKVLRESRYLNSPYSARNRGIEAATGEVVAFLDATCVPRADWLTEGVRCVRLHGHCLVAGRVAFDFGAGEPSGAAIWDSVTNVQQDLAVARGAAKTGNLFVHKRVLEAQGPFREGVRSGEDVGWTSRATAAGWKLFYAEHAIVEYPARGGSFLMRKSARTGAGKARLMRMPHRLAKGGAALVMPPAPWRVHRLLRERANRPIDARLLMRVWAAAWVVRASHASGMLFPALFEHAD